jgi:parallel beta-helix repeat protein
VSNAYVGLWLDGAVGTTISGNTMSNLSGWGMEIHHSGPPVTISKNNVMFAGFFGIDLFYAPSTVTQNSIFGVTYGLNLFNSPGSSIKSNAFTYINGGSGVYINDNGTAGGDTVSKNTINEAPCGINATYAIGDMLTPNTFFNVTSPICP